jgi:hypothetical protein
MGMFHSSERVAVMLGQQAFRETNLTWWHTAVQGYAVF